VVTGARKFDHITPVLHELHWLPVRQRIKFKSAMTVYKCLGASVSGRLLRAGLICDQQTAPEIC